MSFLGWSILGDGAHAHLLSALGQVAQHPSALAFLILRWWIGTEPRCVEIRETALPGLRHALQRRLDALCTDKSIGVAFALQAETIAFVPKSHARQIRFDAVQTKRLMCGAFPPALNGTGRATGIASERTELVRIRARACGWKIPISCSVRRSSRRSLNRSLISVTLQIDSGLHSTRKIE